MKSILSLKHRILLLALLFLFIQHAFSSHVPLDKARQIAKNAYSEGSSIQGAYFPPGKIDIIESITYKVNSTDAFYVFNTNNGYIMVSADDKVFPVLGYGFGHRFSKGDLPPQLEALLESYKAQISWAIGNASIKASQAIRDEWAKYSTGASTLKSTAVVTSVSPLMTSHWSQGCGWNDYCPSDADGPCGHAVVGCVAVAMGQLLYYYQHPPRGHSSHCYTHSEYGQLCANFGSTSYNWASMDDDDPTSAAALLLYHCGISVNMNYGPDGSGGKDGMVAGAISSYFNYNPFCKFTSRGSYTQSEWENMVKTELDNGRPLFYVGWAGDTIGHAFNVDGYLPGYMGINYYHINWGWGGSYDGYYYLDDLTPGDHYFTDNQKALFFVGTEDCYSSLTITQAISGGMHGFLSVSSITATNQISNGAIVHYGANTLVELQKGFEVNPGCKFLANLKGCSGNKSVDITNGKNSGLEGEKQDEFFNGIAVYPNPTNGTINISTDKQPEEILIISIIDINGKTIRQLTTSLMETSIDIGNQPAGIYIVEIVGENEVSFRKVVKQ